jgi:2'-5' RNA ligase
MVEHWRLFIAIPLRNDVRECVRAAQSAARAAGFAARWVEPATAHLTLKFLGVTDQSLVDPLCAALGRVAERHCPLVLRTGPLGAFPQARRPRVLWLDLGGDLAELHLLQRAIDAILVPLGIPAERRPFRPHLTIGRLREGDPVPADALVMAGRALGGTSSEFPVSTIHLIRSELGRTGARYTTLCAQPLTGDR